MALARGARAEVTVSVTTVDFVIAAILVISGLFAAYRGLLHEVMTVLAWALAAVMTGLLFGNIKGIVRTAIEPDWLADIAGFVGLFLVVLIPISFLSYRISESVKSSAIGPLDRSLGFVYGVIRGLVMVAAGYLLYGWIVPADRHPDWVAEARLLPLVKSTGEVMTSFVTGAKRETANLTPANARARPRKPAHRAPQTVVAPPPEPIAEQAYVPPPQQETGPLAPNIFAPAAEPDQAAPPPRTAPSTRPKPRPTPAQTAASRPKVQPKTVSDKENTKGYGARDRKALDQLVRSTSGAQ